MSVKTMFIAPYPSMIPLVEECKAEYPSLNLQIEVGNLEDGVEIAVWAEKNNYDVIISRGGTAQLIKSAVSIPVIDVHLSGYDMLRTLTLANDFQVKKALVGFSNITLGAQSIIDLLDLPIHVYSIRSAQEVDPLINRLKQDGFELILGDVVTIETAQRSGLDGVLIQSGREAIFEAFNNAQSEYDFHTSNQLLIKLLTKTLNRMKRDILILNPDGTTEYEKWNNLERCPLSAKELNDFHLLVQDNRKATRSFPFKKKLIDADAFSYKMDERKYTVILFTVHEHLEKNYRWIKSVDVVLKPVIIMKSAVMKRVIHQIQQSISTQRIYMLNGARGTGKELIAKYIHFERNKPGSFVTIDVRKVDWNLLDESVNGRASTIYFSNIENLEEAHLHDLKAFIQQALNRSLTIILSSTFVMSDLIESSWENDTVEIFLPSLEDRKEDVKGLATYFIAHFHQNLGTQPVKIREAAIDILNSVSWNENVAQFKRFMKSLVLAEKGYVIEADQVQELLDMGNSPIESHLDTHGTLEEIEQRVIQKVLEEEGYNQSKAADRLGINRSTLWRKLKKQ